MILPVVACIVDVSALQRVCMGDCTVEYLSSGPIEKYYVFCDLSVREKDWRSRARRAKAT